MSLEGMNDFFLDKLEKLDDKLEELRLKFHTLDLSFKNHEIIDEQIHEDVKQIAKNFDTQMMLISDSLDKYNLLLQEHIRRTDIAENNMYTLNKNINKLEEDVKPIINDFKEKEIIKGYKAMNIKEKLKIIGATSTVLAIISGILKLLGII